MHIEGYSIHSVCVSVDAYSGTTCYETTQEQYQKLQNYMSLKKIMVILLKNCIKDICRENKRKSQYAKSHSAYLGLIQLDPFALWPLEEQEGTTKGMHQLPHAIYYFFRLFANYLPGDHE